jgi:hypothetical protein
MNQVIVGNMKGQTYIYKQSVRNLIYMLGFRSSAMQQLLDGQD